MSTDSGMLKRVTFEDVLAAQVALRCDIAVLANENRTLRSDELAGFWMNYVRATLGNGAQAGVNTDLPCIDDMTLDELVFNHMSQEDSEGIYVKWADTSEKRLVTPGEIWKMILYRLNTDILGIAMSEALKISPEISGGGAVKLSVHPSELSVDAKVKKISKPRAVQEAQT